MSKRLQVILADEELRELQDRARRKRVTIAEYVRQALRDARASESPDPRRKLELVRAAARHSFPTGDIEELLAQIERGYLGAEEP